MEGDGVVVGDGEVEQGGGVDGERGEEDLRGAVDDDGAGGAAREDIGVVLDMVIGRELGRVRRDDAVGEVAAGAAVGVERGDYAAVGGADGEGFGGG